MRISDWSSDVGSSDLAARQPPRRPYRPLAADVPVDGVLLHRAALDRRADRHRHQLHRTAHRDGTGGTDAGRSGRPAPLGSGGGRLRRRHDNRSEEHTSELQSPMRISYAVFCLQKKTTKTTVTEAHEDTYRTARHPT